MCLLDVVKVSHQIWQRALSVQRPGEATAAAAAVLAGVGVGGRPLLPCQMGWATQKDLLKRPTKSQGVTRSMHAPVDCAWTLPIFPLSQRDKTDSGNAVDILCPGKSVLFRSFLSPSVREPHLLPRP